MCSCGAAGISGNWFSWFGGWSVSWSSWWSTGLITTLGSKGILVFEVVGYGVAFAFVCAGIFALTGLGVGAGGPFSAICCPTDQLYFLQ